MEKKDRECSTSCPVEVSVEKLRSNSLASYLHHGDHAIVADRVCADGEVARRVSTDDPVDGIPVRGVGLVGIYHCQISHHKIHPVLWDLAGELPEKKKKRLPRDLLLHDIFILTH